MTDITLKTIASGYNLNKINDNFVTLEDNINNTSIQSTGGNNVMSQDFDMNSKRMINLPAPVSGSEPIRLSDAEALALSQDIFSKTALLTKAFQVTSPPQYHNFLVNVGVKEKGLCHHWSDALYVYLNSKQYTQYEFHLLGANIGEYWKEHNVLVVVAKGQSWQDGVILDPWRDSGRLYFSTVKEDSKYVWKHRPQRGCF